ncbi:Pentatricopeptide repeat-containing protein [Acorus calamus]|uniref:Pentatricopeptide repeat-containing protein n=1 Tax=Acorus calamus TaxID=4465 RepID=A0AAV9F817_ACOCL|nr:Pentatricopeptide repeat-containing protein [Acorus calamus]
MATRVAAGRAKYLAKRHPQRALYKTLFRNGMAEEAIRTEVDRFLNSKKKVLRWEFGLTLSQLHHLGLYDLALKLSETLNQRGMTRRHQDLALYFDLVTKTRGIKEAEKCFIEIPDFAKTQPPYNALLKCYCEERMTEKAEGIMKKMKELRLTSTPVPYNLLMTLYIKTDHPERIPLMIQEMKTDDIMLDVHSYNLWMKGIAATGDVSGAERVFEEMKSDGQVIVDWTTYNHLALIYVEAGLFDKAEVMLTELEKRINDGDLEAHQCLIRLYGRTGNSVKVHQFWQSLKPVIPMTQLNKSYLNMMRALADLNELPNLETCFKEWESLCETHDIHVVNVMMEAYAKAGLIDKAIDIQNHALVRGAKLNSKTHEILMDYYWKGGEFASTIKCINDAVSARGEGTKWVPPMEIVVSLMGHFKLEDDVDGAEAFLNVLEESGMKLGAEVFEPLIQTYAYAGKTDRLMRRRLKMENVVVSDETDKLLDNVCVE